MLFFWIALLSLVDLFCVGGLLKVHNNLTGGGGGLRVSDDLGVP
jgi:hypothetical protein